MKFEVGDNVVVKHSNEDGRVIEILNDKMVVVEVRGVRFPAYTDQLDFPYFKQFSSKKLVETAQPEKKYIDQLKREKNAPRYQVADGVWLLFFPKFSRDVLDDEVVDELKVYLVNQTNQALSFHFWLKHAGTHSMELQNQLPALQDFYLLNIDMEDLGNSAGFYFEWTPLHPDKKLADYFETSYKPKAKQLFKQIEQLKLEGNAFFSHLLFKDYPEKQAAAPAPTVLDPMASLSRAGFTIKAGKQLQPMAPMPSVLDLHIEKLTDDYGNMTAHEKLELQLRKFEKWLNKAQLHYLTHLWVIHGVGGGRLRQEVHEILKHHPHVKSFVSQYHPWYGNGATEIYLK